MNDLFVNVKVDREERPDLDSVYMDAVVALTGHGGWPMTVFLTPEGEPFFGGTYYPPEPRHGLPSFRQVLEGVARGLPRAARGRRARGARSWSRPSAPARGAPSREPLTESLLAEAARAPRGVRPAVGRLRRAPKFPPASALEFLLRARRARRSCAKTLDGDGGSAACTTCSAAASIATRSTSSWLVPHFEKMLYDNALLVPAYLHGWLVTGRSATARSPRRRSTTSSASCACRTAASPRRRTPTRTASRG